MAYRTRWRKRLWKQFSNLKNSYGGDFPAPAVPERGVKRLKDLPSRPGTVIGNVSRVEIYDGR